MIKALLLDLDNTLLDIDFDRFMQEYVQLVGRRFAGTVSLEDFRRQLFASTRVMMENEYPARTVLQAFIDDFFPVLRLPASAMDVFMDFYRNEYSKLKHVARPMPHARQLVETAFARGLTVVVATAPLFPAEAIRERLRWAELDGFPYDLITSAEAMHFSKPFPRYYLEIAAHLDLPPGACLMVGDELSMDGTAAGAGMRVALVGPEMTSATVKWLAGGSEDVGATSPPRYPSLAELQMDLRAEGIL